MSEKRPAGDLDLDMVNQSRDFEFDARKHLLPGKKSKSKEKRKKEVQKLQESAQKSRQRKTVSLSSIHVRKLDADMYEAMQRYIFFNHPDWSATDLILNALAKHYGLTDDFSRSKPRDTAVDIHIRNIPDEIRELMVSEISDSDTRISATEIVYDALHSMIPDEIRQVEEGLARTDVAGHHKV